MMTESLIKEFPEDGDHSGNLPQRKYPSTKHTKTTMLSKNRDKYNRELLNRVLAKALIKIK